MDTFFYFYTGFKEITDFFYSIYWFFLQNWQKKGFHIIFIFSCKISWLGNCKSLRKTRRKSLHYQICISYFNYIKFNCNIAILKWNTLLNVEILKFWLFGGFFCFVLEMSYKNILYWYFFLKSQYTFQYFLNILWFFI
jgi:hypothetical protein